MSAGQPILQSGVVTPGHPLSWTTDGVAQDAGPATGGNLTGVGITNNGNISFAINSGPTTAAYVQYGVAVSNDGTITMYFNPFGGAPSVQLNYVINGQTYAYVPGGGGTGNVVGPTSAVAGDILTFNGTSGRLIEDSGILAANIVQGPSAANSGDLALFNGTTGKLIKDSSIASTAMPLVVATVAALEAATSTTLPNNQIFLQGFYAKGDGGEGPFYLGTPTTANGGTIINDASGRSWYRETGGKSWSIRWFGAYLDGTQSGVGGHDDTTPWNNCTAAARLAGNPAIYHPGGFSNYTGNLALKNDTIIGVGSYYAVPGASAISQESMIVFHGNNAGLTLVGSTSGNITLEKIGFVGVPGTYTGQTGLLMSDTLRPSGPNEGWPTLRDVLFQGFANGILVGNTYQSGWMWNVYIADSTTLGYQNQSTDWYHYMLTCGSSLVTASVAQLLLGTTSSTPLTYAAGSHQFHGGAFFNGENTIIIQGSFSNIIQGAQIQNAQNTGLQCGNGTLATDFDQIIGCTFSGNNAAGGARNANGTDGVDISVTAGSRGVQIIGCSFALPAEYPTCVAAGISIAYEADGTQVIGCQFNMDNIVTPGAPSDPLAIKLLSPAPNYSIDNYQIENNFAFYGQFGDYPFKFLPVNLASVGEPYTVNSTLSIQAGTAVLASPSGNIYCTLADPGFAGRPLFITEETGGGGDTVTAATTGAFGGGHTTATFTAAGAYASMISASATTWQVLNSSNVTFS